MTRVDISADNSYVFTNPLKAQADGKEKIRVTVFILNSQGLGVLGKNVSISLDSHLILDAVQPATDQSGKALFDISSSTPGEYYLEVSVDEFKLPQKTRLTFLQ